MKNDAIILLWQKLSQSLILAKLWYLFVATLTAQGSDHPFRLNLNFWSQWLLPLCLSHFHIAKFHPRDTLETLAHPPSHHSPLSWTCPRCHNHAPAPHPGRSQRSVTGQSPQIQCIWAIFVIISSSPLTRPPPPHLFFTIIIIRGFSPLPSSPPLLLQNASSKSATTQSVAKFWPQL